MSNNTTTLPDFHKLPPREMVSALVNLAAASVNAGVSRTLTARRSSENPPKDTRHLTDTRTRVSTLLEYSLAFEMNQILAAKGQGFTLSAVLWNVFPDLFIRNPKREPIIGLEVKALHTAAEEKSANLSTPLYVIKKDADFVVIIIWSWERLVENGVAIHYPHIHSVDVFDAWLLAKMRDDVWLFNQGGRVKGIDIGTPIINGKTPAVFKAEEGNMGKLMRIELSESLPKSTPSYNEMHTENEGYTGFKTRTLLLALTSIFREVCFLQEASDIRNENLKQYPTNARLIAQAKLPGNLDFMLLAGNKPMNFLEAQGQKAVHPSGTVALWLSSKLAWKLYKKTDGKWTLHGDGLKADAAYEDIEKALRGC